MVREGMFFLVGGGGEAGASEGRVISESEHQKGRVRPLCKLYKGRVTTFSRIFNEDFCDAAFNFSYRLNFSFLLL